MNVRAAFANTAWLASSMPALRSFTTALLRPESAQRDWLRRSLRANADCEYGRAYGFEEIHDYEWFREQVPIVEHGDLEPWIERVTRGKSSVLTAAPVQRLLPTSGSTGGRKLIPFTAASQRDINAAIGPWMLDLVRQFPRLPLGPAYWSISPAIGEEEFEQSAVPIGFDNDSAYLGGMRRRLTEATFAVPPSVRLVRDIDQHRYLTLLHLLGERDLRLISVWHPSFLVLLLQALSRRWEELIEDLARGGCRRLRDCAAFNLPARPNRARELLWADPREVRSVWPRLQLVSCWGDAQSEFAFADLSRRVAGVAVQRKGLVATEGIVTLPFRGAHPIAVTSHFFEFLDESGTARVVGELRRGKIYEVVITTGGGLWRYRLGDLVEVDGFVAATPSLRFLGRGRRTSDLCGEKLNEAFVTKSLVAVFEMTGIIPSFAMLAPEAGGPDGSPHYTLFVDAAPIRGVADAIDSELRRNPHYALCRDLGQLGEIECCVVKSTAFEIYRNVAAPNRRLGDIKPESLSTRTDWRQYLSSEDLSGTSPSPCGSSARASG